MGERKKGKRAARPSESDHDTIWIGISASEANLERLAALLMFADRTTILEVKRDEEVGPLPWEDPPAEPPSMEEAIDYDTVTRAIVKLLAQYVKKHGEASTKAVLESFGAPRLSQIAQSQLLDLHAALEAALQEEPAKENEAWSK